MTDEQIARVAAGLSKAQKAYLTTKAEWLRERWMTYPPNATHQVLREMGLVGPGGTILETGLRVRAHIMGEG